MNVDLRSEIRLASFCSGAAGFDLALKLALPNARTVLYVEREAYACAVLEARIQEKTLDDAPIWSDIATFDGEPWRGRVDILLAGFNCQPWSVAGSQKGTEDERWIWPILSDRICEMGPPVVYLENVPGLVSGHGIEHVLSDLAQMGYDAEWGTLSAESLGFSHKRERLFIVAWHAGYGARGLAILAHAAKRGQRELWEPSRGAGQPDGDDQDMEDAQGQRPGEAGQLRPERPADGNSGAVSHVGEPQLPRRRQVQQHHKSTTGREQAASGLGSDQQGVANPSLGLVSELRRGQEGRDGAGPAIPLFCPGPADFRAWARLLEQRPDLAPAIKSEILLNVDGLSSRVDALRLAGNALVPIVAAAAFCLLARRALE